MNVNNVLMMRFRLRCKDCANSLVDKKFVMAHINSVHIEENVLKLTKCFLVNLELIVENAIPLVVINLI